MNEVPSNFRGGANSRRAPWTVFWAEASESFAMAMAALASHKLRSALTLLGVLVGVFSIVLVMTAIRVLQSNIEDGLSALGVDTFQVQKWPAFPVDGPSRQRIFRRKDFKYEDGERLRARATLAASIGMEAGLQEEEAASRYARTNPNVGLLGVTPEVFSARKWTLAEGRPLMQSDLDGVRRVCVLGHGLGQKLFPRGSPIGERVRFDGINYRVVGLLEGKGGMFGGDQDVFLAIPLTTGLNHYGAKGRSLSILVQARNQTVMEDTMEQVRGVLRTIRRVPPGEEDDFEITSNDSLINQFRNITFAVRMGAAVISSIALIAAGIGIMNIMLVSVTERTREIGIRRAVGAKKRNIMTQFILEAVTLCEVGGVIGVGLGILGGNVAAYFLSVTPVIPFDWAFFGLLICSLVGVIFGTYPAYKAANLDPIESLRYE